MNLWINLFIHTPKIAAVDSLVERKVKLLRILSFGSPIRVGALWKTQMGWTDERVEELKVLWGEGLSASQVARALGGVTRNAVISKVHRLGLGGRGRPSSPHLRRVSVPRAPRPVVEKPRPVTVEEPVTLGDGGHVTALTVNDRTCRWPIGDPGDEAFHFCGHPPKPGAPYCEGHCAKAWQPHVNSLLARELATKDARRTRWR